MTWTTTLAGISNNIEYHYDHLRFRLKHRFKRFDPLQILPYFGFGTEQSFYLRGRVLEEKGVTTLDELTDNETVWDNLLDMYRRLESDEVPGARLLARYGDIERELITDSEGYFDFQLELTGPPQSLNIWQPVAFELIEPHIDGHDPVQATGQILIPPPEAKFGVISDIDDTIIRTSATHLLKMARIVFLGNARTRLPFKGAAAFYKALQQGSDGLAENPLFYVSSSPWNLYDLLIDVFKLQNIPPGPLLLRDYGFSAQEILPVGHKKHKVSQIQKILDTYPHLPFVLIGDSGQEDPEIYQEIVKRYPDRILAIYIRDVTEAARDKTVEPIIESLAAAGVTMLLVSDTVAAAEHAAQSGLISPTTLPGIKVDKALDDLEPAPVEKLL